MVLTTRDTKRTGMDLMGMDRMDIQITEMIIIINIGTMKDMESTGTLMGDMAIMESIGIMALNGVSMVITSSFRELEHGTWNMVNNTVWVLLKFALSRHQS